MTEIVEVPAQTRYEVKTDLEDTILLAQKYGTFIGSCYGEEVLTKEDKLSQVKGITGADILIEVSQGEDDTVGLLAYDFVTPQTHPAFFEKLKDFPEVKVVIQGRDYAVARSDMAEM